MLTSWSLPTPFKYAEGANRPLVDRVRALCNSYFNISLYLYFCRIILIENALSAGLLRKAIY